MPISKFALACVAATAAGAAWAGAASRAPEPAAPPRMLVGTPVSAIHDAGATLRDVPVEFASGHRFGRVVGVATRADGGAARVQVAVDGARPQVLWLSDGDLIYSRARDAIVAKDVHAPDLAIAAR